jgi:SAM-dependent methyltransferase
MGTVLEIRRWWRDQRTRETLPRTLRRLLGTLWEFARESTPEQRRRRYGDMDFDWERRVDTTGGSVGWRERLVGMFHSSYQPTEPAEFHEMMSALDLDFPQFTFIDVGSGKGRVLLMAADYPFRRIVGIELLPELHRIAQENIRQYHSDVQRCFALESICVDAREFALPDEPTVLYLFNPLPEPGMMRLIENLEGSLRKHPRPVRIVYQNPVLEYLLAQSTALKKINRTDRYAVYSRD